MRAPDTPRPHLRRAYCWGKVWMWVCSYGGFTGHGFTADHAYVIWRQMYRKDWR